MFRIVDRYIGRQVILSTTFAVVVLSVVLVLGQIFRKLLDLMVQGLLSPSAVLRFVANAFPWSLAYTIPWGLLTAVLLTFGRLSADNELISLRMSGMSLRRICRPVFFIAAAGSALCFWINTKVAPEAYPEIRRTAQQAVLADPEARLVPGKIVDDITGFHFFTERKEGRRMKNVQVFMMQPERAGERAQPEKFVFARSAELFSEDAVRNRELKLELENSLFASRSLPATLSREERAAMSAEELAAYSARLRAANEGVPSVVAWTTTESPAVMPLHKLFERANRLHVGAMSMSQLRAGIDNPAALAMEGTEVPSRSKMRTEYHRRLSFSLACFVLALAGIPFGITAQRRETSVGFVLSLAVGISYFALIMLGGLWQDRPEKYPHLWVWLPNVVFGTLGTVMFIRLQRR